MSWNLYDFFADERMVVSGSRDTSVRLWDVETGACAAKAMLPRNVVTDVKWVPGDFNVVAQVRSVVVSTCCSRKSLSTLRGYRHCLQSCEDLHVRLWDTRIQGTLKLAAALEGYVYFPVGCATFDGGKRLCKVVTACCFAQIAMDVSADGNYLFTSSKGFNSMGAEGRVRLCSSRCGVLPPR